MILNGAVELNYQVVGGEERLVVCGATNSGRFLTICLTFRGSSVRVITGWKAEPEEEACYWKERKNLEG